MAKVLVTGIDEMLGANLALCFAAQHDCVGLFSKHKVEPNHCSSRPCETTSTAITQMVREVAPDWVVYCSPLSRSSWDAPASPQDESDLVRALANETGSRGIALTVIGTDAVHRGPWLFPEENCPATSPSAHAQEARRLENCLKGSHALVVRTHAYGWSPCEEEPTFAEELYHRLKGVESVPGDGVRYATPILATDLAESLQRAFELRLEGLYHMTGAERTNPHRFIGELAFALGMEGDLSRRVEIAAPEREKVTLVESSLNTHRARRQLGRPMPLLREGLGRFVAQAVDGFVEKLRVGTEMSGKRRVAA